MLPKNLLTTDVFIERGKLYNNTPDELSIGYLCLLAVLSHYVGVRIAHLHKVINHLILCR